MTVGYKPWTLDFAGTLSWDRERKQFAKLTEALKWIDDTENTKGFLDPEWSADVEVHYAPHPDWEEDPDELSGLISGRVVAKVIDGWAEGGRNYRLEIEQPSYRQAFWMGEGDFILFDSRDL